MMPRSTSPTVSVCIPTYKGAKYLGWTIESVLNQGFSDFELLIVDDNSPDETTAVVAQFQDARIRFLRNPTNLGAEGNWNRCLAESRGRYFKLLPQDDLLAPDCLQQQVAVLEQDTEKHIALVCCARSIIDPQGRIIMRRGYPGGRQGMINGTTLRRRCLRYAANLVGEPGSVLFRRDLARETGLFNGSLPYVIDLDYWFRLLLRGDAYYLPQTLASFRVSLGSWSVAIGTRQNLEFRRFIAKIAQDPAFHTTWFDVLIGNTSARLNSRLRTLLYRLILQRKGYR